MTETKTSTKSIFKSVTFWGIIISAGFKILALSDIEGADLFIDQLNILLEDDNALFTSFIGDVLALFGRWRAKMQVAIIPKGASSL